MPAFVRIFLLDSSTDCTNVPDAGNGTEDMFLDSGSWRSFAPKIVRVPTNTDVGAERNRVRGALDWIDASYTCADSRDLRVAEFQLPWPNASLSLAIQT